jgi:hypothetical protein
VIWLALVCGFLGGVAGALTLALGESAWFAVTKSPAWQRLNNRVIGWQVRRAHRRSGRV